MKQSIFIRRKTVWLLITLFSVIANVNVCAQELDFSKLDDAQPQETLLQVEKYKEALGTTWQNISSVKNGVYWNVPYSNQEFSLNILYTQIRKLKEDFKSYLVSPSLSLRDIAGKQLNFEWKTGTIKGDIKLSVLLINKSGETIATLGNVIPVSSNSDYEKYSVDIPIAVKEKGIGFVAFM